MTQSILLLGLNYAPEPVGIGPYSAALAESLAARGHTVEVIAGKPYYPQWRLDPAHAADNWKTREESGVQVTRCPHYVPAEPGGFKRIVHLASFALSSLLPALRVWLQRDRQKPQLVIAVAPALFSVLTAWLLARLCGAKLWVHVQDFEVEAALATGLLPQGSTIARIAGKAEASILGLADQVSTISPQMCAKLIDKGVAPARVIEIRNWADSRFAPDSEGADAIRREWNLGQRKVALYSGNIARKQGIEILVEAARLLTERDDITFVICGEGPNRIELERLAEGLPNIQLHNLQPATRMGAMLTMADIHLLPQIAGAADLVLPSKLTNMLLSGRPVVATTEPGTGLYHEVDGCGVITPPGDAAALAAAIDALANDPERRSALGGAASRRAQERWMKDAIIDRVEEGIARIGSG